MSSAYVFLADGFEEVEALTTVDLLRRADIDVKTVSISDSLTLRGRSKIEVIADMMWDEAKPDAVDMLILPGGMPGTTYLMNHKGLGKALKKAAEEGRFVAAICAAPTVLGALGLLKGKKATCYPGMESQLGGAEIVLDKEAVRDDKVITSRGAGTSAAFALKLIKALEGEDRARAVAREIVYKA
ncbi:MAG: DJ-1/PfpI family protein [Lachnospiraceae bacterium]|nr:DJ-1/PfpI family protein [Lachnospiraceae bacterium]